MPFRLPIPSVNRFAGLAASVGKHKLGNLLNQRSFLPPADHTFLKMSLSAESDKLYPDKTTKLFLDPERTAELFEEASHSFSTFEDSSPLTSADLSLESSPHNIIIDTLSKTLHDKPTILGGFWGQLAASVVLNPAFVALKEGNFAVYGDPNRLVGAMTGGTLTLALIGSLTRTLESELKDVMLKIPVPGEDKLVELGMTREQITETKNFCATILSGVIVGLALTPVKNVGMTAAIAGTSVATAARSMGFSQLVAGTQQVLEKSPIYWGIFSAIDKLIPGNHGLAHTIAGLALNPVNFARNINIVGGRNDSTATAITTAIKSGNSTTLSLAVSMAINSVGYGFAYSKGVKASEGIGTR